MKRKVIYGLLTLILILALVVPGCLPKRDTTTANPATDAERVAALESKVSQLQSKIASLPESKPTDYSGDIDQLYDEIADLRAELDGILDEVDAMLAAWEEQQEEQQSNGEGSTKESITTTWSWEVITTDVSIKLDPEPWISPWRIKDADDYTIRLTLVNNTDKAVSTQVGITFTPRTGDRVYVDKVNTFLDPIATPFVLWETEVYTRGDDKYARYISCNSDYYTVPAGGKLELKLIFTLTYK